MLYVLVALIAVLSLIAARIFYEMVLQNYRTFTEAVRSAIDLYRFDLLTALHVPLPKDSREEKDRWERLTRWTDQEEDKGLILYEHDTREGPGESHKL